MQSNRLVIKARAKINLALDVLYKREDGYHEVAMVMQAIDLSDQVILRQQSSGITVSTSLPGLDCGPSNLAFRAAALIGERFRVQRGVRIELDKNIPVAAGLAGGSTDAAAVLSGLNQLWELGLGMTQLEEMAAMLGADVPFCLHGGTMLASGRGDKLTRLPALTHTWIVLAKPSAEVSTAWVYSNYRPETVMDHPDISGMISCLQEQDLTGVAGKIGNVLESVTIPAYPEIAALKECMLKHGAMATLMSGSGPTVFALVPERRQAELLAATLARRFDAQIIITKIADSVEEEDGTKIVAD